MRNLPVIHSPHDDSALNTFNAMREMILQISQRMQDLVARGQLTPAQYAELLTTLYGLIQKGEVTLDDMHPEVLEELNKANPEFNLLSIPRDRSVDPGKTTFFNTGGNLFDGEYQSGLLVRDSFGTLLRPTENFDGYEGMTAVVPVEPGKTYDIVADPAHSNVFRIGLHATEVGFGTQPVGYALDRTVFSADGLSSYSVRVQDNEHFLYVYVSNNGTEVPLRIYESTLNRAYIPPLEDQSVGPKQTTFFQEGSGENLFSGIYHDGLLFYSLHPEEGDVLYLRNNYNDFKGKIAIIPVDPDTTYAVKVHDTPTSDVFRIGLMDIYPEFVSSNQLSYTVDDFVTEQRTQNKEYVFTTKSTTQYALIYVSNDGSEPRLMVNEGTEYKPFVSNIFIPAQYLQLPEPPQSTAVNDGKYAFPGNFDAYYAEPELPDYFTNPTTLTPAAFHNQFKQLIDQHEGAARTYLDDDDFGNPLYQYEIKPLEYYNGTYWNQNPGDEGTPVKLPKIIVTAGIHGRERNVSYAAYYLFKAILENPNNIEALDVIRTNVHLIVIPIASPSGFIDNTYENGNGMNINRDFPPYGAVTQGETKRIKQVLDDNADMDFFIDYHNMQPRHDLIGYSLTDNEFFKNMTLNMYRRVGRHWQQKESGMPQAINHRWAYTVASNEGTVGRYVNDVLGVPSALIEIPLEYQWGSEGRHGPKNTQMGVDILMNTIFACIKSRQ